MTGAGKKVVANSLRAQADVLGETLRAVPRDQDRHCLGREARSWTFEVFAIPINLRGQDHPKYPAIQCGEQ
jgi:hypothetical protein